MSRVLYRCLRANSPLGVAVLALVLAAYFVALHFVRGGGGRMVRLTHGQVIVAQLIRAT